MNTYSRVYAKIDLDAVCHNLVEIRRLLRPDTRIIAVVKTDGYGHGAVEIATAIEKEQCIAGFATATAEEALKLRRSGIRKPVLILGHVFAEHYEKLVQEEIRPAIFTLEAAKKLSDAAVLAGRDAVIHIKVDTGMSRIGMRAAKESARMIAQIQALPHRIIEGIFTHFACADEADETFTKAQLAQFEQFVAQLEADGIHIPYRHCSNSAAVISCPDAHMDLVRAGIILYGLWPSDEIKAQAAERQIRLWAALELKSHVAYVKDLEAGRRISYGGTYTTARPSKIATIPVGYGDGYPRSLSDKGYVLIHGRRAPILGRICMDQFMVDVTDAADVREGDEVTLAGVDGAKNLSLEELGALSGRFNYEFACCLGKRIPRIYYKDGVRVSETDS